MPDKGDGGAVPTFDARHCGVCGLAPHKYKCPTCRKVRYCSSKCFKAHKEASCAPAPPRSAAPKRPAPAPVPNRRYNKRGRFGRRPQRQPEPEEGEPGFLRVEDTQLRGLLRDEKLCSALRDPKLQALIESIVTGVDPTSGAQVGRLAALEASRKGNPKFSEFADSVLVGIGVCQRHKDGRVEFVAHRAK